MTVGKEVASGNAFNPLPAEFLKWNNPPNIFGIVHYQF